MENPPARKIKVLIVDDCPEQRLWLNRAMAILKCHPSGPQVEIIEASNGLEALDEFNQTLAAGDPISIVITDWQMPVAGGEEVIRGVKNMAPDCPVILITGNKEVAPALAPESIFFKPYNVDRLLEEVVRLLMVEW